MPDRAKVARLYPEMAADAGIAVRAGRAARASRGRGKTAKRTTRRR
jgi:hypothetical protein